MGTWRLSRRRAKPPSQDSRQWQTPAPNARPGLGVLLAVYRSAPVSPAAKRRHKRDLVRVVHTASGHVEVDATGKKAGRGAYLCAKKACWDLGLKKHALERALKTTVSAGDMLALQGYAETLTQ